MEQPKLWSGSQVIWSVLSHACWEKDQQYLSLASQVSLHMPRLFPCQQGAFCVGSPESYLPANLGSISSVRMAGLQRHSSEPFLLETGLCPSSYNGLQVTGNTACRPSPRGELASQASCLPPSWGHEDVHSSNRSGSATSSSFF